MHCCTLCFSFQPADQAIQAQDYLSKMTLDVGTVREANLANRAHSATVTVHLELPNTHGPSPRDIRRLVTAAGNFDGSVDVESTALNAPGRRIIRIVFTEIKQALSALALLGGAAFENDAVNGVSSAVDQAGNVIISVALVRKEGRDLVGMHPRDLCKLIKITWLLNGTIDEIRRCEIPRD